MAYKKCKICGKEFYVKPFSIRNGWGTYCSRQCHYKDKTGKHFNCFICGVKIYRTSKQIKHSKSKKYFCNKSCQTKWRNAQFVGELHKNWKTGRAEYSSILQRNDIAKICKNCGINDPRVLATHHIDGNHLNNKLENLEWLCHNCHHLVHRVKMAH